MFYFFSVSQPACFLHTVPFGDSLREKESAVPIWANCNENPMVSEVYVNLNHVQSILRIPRKHPRECSFQGTPFSKFSSLNHPQMKQTLQWKNDGMFMSQEHPKKRFLKKMLGWLSPKSQANNLKPPPQQTFWAIYYKSLTSFLRPFLGGIPLLNHHHLG